MKMNLFSFSQYQDMKKIAILLLACLSMSCANSQKKVANKKIAGLWEGKINAGAPLRIVFHFDPQADSSYAGIMDSPDQNVKGIHCDSVKITGDSVSVKVLVISGGFTGHIINDTTIIGNWTQRGMQIALTLKKEKAVSILNRPQTPQRPFSYNSQDVEYDNEDKTVHFGATLTWPKGEGPFPTAIMITGSGQQDRDETIFGHKPFAVIADYLTKKGYAVLRIDDRGMGKTTGDVKNATSVDFAKDIETALAYLKTRKEVDKKRIGMIGHSEGGLIASLVASRNTDINFIIMLAGPGVKGSELMLAQAKAALESVGISAHAADVYGLIYKKITDDVITEKDTAKLYDKIMADFTQWRKNQPKALLDTLNIHDDEDYTKKIVLAFTRGLESPWMKYFLQSDPQPLMEKFTCKVLALDGSKDIQVISSLNLDGINKALKKSKSPSFETKELPGLNHLFQHCKTCTVAEYGQLEETFSPEALDIMGKWLDQNVK
jgi:pimeloyl-ACP methyl ester carboxylesterase